MAESMLFVDLVVLIVVIGTLIFKLMPRIVEVEARLRLVEHPPIDPTPPAHTRAVRRLFAERYREGEVGFDTLQRVFAGEFDDGGESIARTVPGVGEIKQWVTSNEAYKYHNGFSTLTAQIDAAWRTDPRRTAVLAVSADDPAPAQAPEVEPVVVDGGLGA